MGAAGCRAGAKRVQNSRFCPVAGAGGGELPRALLPALGLTSASRPLRCF